MASQRHPLPQRPSITQACTAREKYEKLEGTALLWLQSGRVSLTLSGSEYSRGGKDGQSSESQPVTSEDHRLKGRDATTDNLDAEVRNNTQRPPYFPPSHTSQFASLNFSIRNHLFSYLGPLVKSFES